MSDETEVRPATPRPPSGAARFAPGMVIAERYRIVAPLGRGGMGEVYRADDLKLDQPVALKFLPPQLSHDRVRLEHLYSEVRVGRQVSHPNVCRLYDVGEWHDVHFIAMELVDGEDLASLLRRIGRLPSAKALELSRDIASGLAAAHELGIVHRDLKPANVMIDGRGKARLTDFGLAALAEDLKASGGWAGTPAYMAPEQLRGEPATMRSDVYALGLVMVEMITGKSGSQAKPPSVSGEVRDVDPLVERVIMRCLENDPNARPATAAEVVRALPGGDPLAAAMAAGETPSPEMVAAAGATGDLVPRVAWTLLAIAIAFLLLVAKLSDRAKLFGLVPLPKSTEVLEARARDIAATFGATHIADRASYWGANWDYLRYMERKVTSGNRWQRIGSERPGVALLINRFSPRPMISDAKDHRVTSEDPPFNFPGMSRVLVDPEGRLIFFATIASDRPPQTKSQPFDWTIAMREAGLDPARFHAVSSSWACPVSADEHHAWEGTLAERPDVPLHVEAAAQWGRPVYFDVIGPWNSERREAPPRAGLGFRISEAANEWLTIILVVIAAFLAARNLARGRGDRRGALRVFAFYAVTAAIAFVFRATWNGFLSALLEDAIKFSVFEAGRLWLFYMAMEPYVRRRWPHVLISWSRLLEGRWRDPMVGRDALIGAMAGTAINVVRDLTRIVPPWLGFPTPAPYGDATSPFASARHVIFFLFHLAAEYTFSAFTLIVAMLVLRALIRNRIALHGITLAILTACFIFDGGDDLRLQIVYGLIVGAIMMTVLLRAGFLSLVVTSYVYGVLRTLPVTLDNEVWYFGRSLLTLLVIAAIAVYGFKTALASKPLFGKPLFEE